MIEGEVVMVMSRAGLLAVLRGAVVEYAWSGAHLALWPFGFRNAARAGAAGGAEPVLLVHGVIDNRSIFTMLGRSLRRAGCDVHTINYSLLTNDVPAAAERLAAAVEKLCAATGRSRVRLVGHSLGGLIARYYVQRMDGDRRVTTLVTLCTPHQGTRLAWLLPLRLTRQLRPNSALLAELAEPAPDCRTRMVALWSPLDEVIIPGRHARLVHPDLDAENIEIPVGHQSMAIDARALAAVATALGTAVRLAPAPRPPTLREAF